jgi:hypothetical protein
MSKSNRKGRAEQSARRIEIDKVAIAIRRTEESIRAAQETIYRLAEKKEAQMQEMLRQTLLAVAGCGCFTEYFACPGGVVQ